MRARDGDENDNGERREEEWWWCIIISRAWRRTMAPTDRMSNSSYNEYARRRWLEEGGKEMQRDGGRGIKRAGSESR